MSLFSKKPVSAFPSQRHTTSDLFFLVPTACVFLTWGLGTGSLASWDEALYATVAKEIVTSGDWINFTMNGQPWADKPPLAIWATAFLYKVFGVNEFASRLFSALCGVGVVITTYFLGRQLFNRWTGFLGALILLSTSHFLRFSRFGMLDVPLTFFMTLGFTFFWLGHYRNRYLIFSGVAIGLAIMTKGFAALFVFPVLWLYCIISGRGSLLLRSSYWVGVMIAVVIALPWHLYQIFAHKDMFMHDALIRHVFERTTTVLDGHAGNWYFYIRTLINKFHPWIFIVLFSAPLGLYRALKEREDEAIFLSVWIFFILGAVSIIRTKLPWYIIPIYPALSLTAADLLQKVLREQTATYAKAMFIIVLVLHVTYSNLFHHDYSRDIKGIAASMPEAPEGQPIFLYNYHEQPAVSFYLGRTSAYVDTKEDFLKQASERRFTCMIHTADLEGLRSELPRLGLSTKASFEELHLIGKD